MLDEVQYCKKIMKKEFNKPLRMTKDDEEKFQKADECHICNKNIPMKTSKFETTAISLVNTEDQPIRNAI